MPRNAPSENTNPETTSPPPSAAKSMADVLIDALKHLQEDKKLTDMRTWAKDNLTEFYKMAARIIPTADNDALVPISEIEIIHTYEDKSQQGTV